VGSIKSQLMYSALSRKFDFSDGSVVSGSGLRG
jgi:hypothetical protein